MLSTSVVILFFLMLLAPCFIAVISSRSRDEDEEFAEAALHDAEAEALLHAATAQGFFAYDELAAHAPEDHAGSAFLVEATVESSRAEELRAMLHAAELAGRHAARTQAMGPHDDLDELRRLVAEAEAEAVTAQIVAAQARATAMTAASRAANVRVRAAAQVAERARATAEMASRAAYETRESYTRRRIAERAEAEARRPEKTPDDPSMHYPRARVGRRAA